MAMREVGKFALWAVGALVLLFAVLYVVDHLTADDATATFIYDGF